MKEWWKKQKAKLAQAWEDATKNGDSTAAASIVSTSAALIGAISSLVWGFGMIFSRSAYTLGRTMLGVCAAATIVFWVAIHASAIAKAIHERTKGPRIIRWIPLIAAIVLTIPASRWMLEYLP